MNELHEMLGELCSEGVAFKTIDDVFIRRNGYTPSKSKSEFWTNGTIPWFRMEDIAGNGCVLDDAVQHVSPLALKSGRAFPANSIIVATSATIGVHALITCDFLCNQRFTCLTLKESYDSILDIEFLNHYCHILDDYCLANVNQGSFASVKMGAFGKFRIPILPIALQRELVRILDTSDAIHGGLVAAKRKEIELLEKQTVSLCDTLICHNNYQRFSLGELGTLTRGKRFTAADYAENGIPSIHYGEVYTNYGTSTDTTVSHVRNEMRENLRYAEPNDVIIACTGENRVDICKPVAWLGNGRVAVHDDCHIFHHEMDARYVSYAMLTSEFREQKIRAATESKVVRVSGKKLAAMTIPVPPLERQREIANILDEAFDVTRKLDNELAAEIELLVLEAKELRTKLLSFPEKTT